MPRDPRLGSLVVDQENNALLDRLHRLEQLLKASGTAHPPDFSGAPTAAAARDALTSPRLRPLIEEVARRTGTDDWDVADALAARVLLDELTASLRGCRLVTNTVSARLGEAHASLREARSVLLRQSTRVIDDRSDERAAD